MIQTEAFEFGNMIRSYLAAASPVSQNRYLFVIIKRYERSDESTETDIVLCVCVTHSDPVF